MSNLEISLKDVAKIANVSTATVSRVINNATGVSKDKREAVENAAVRLGLDLSDLRKGRRVLNIAFVTRRMLFGPSNAFCLNLFYSTVFRGVEEEAAAQKCNLLFTGIDDAEVASGVLPSPVKSRTVDGVLVAGHLNPRAADTLLESGLPIVYLDNWVSDDAHCVVTDNVGGIRAAVKHLGANAEGDMAYLSGPSEHFSFRERIAGYRCAIGELGLKVDRDSIYCTPSPGLKGGYELAERVYGGGGLPLPRSILCANDEMAMGFLRWANERGVRIPDDVAVAGFDDVEIAAHVYPTLTTVHVYKEYMGALGLRKLVDMIRGETFHPPLSVVPTRLVVRDSAPVIGDAQSSEGEAVS